METETREGATKESIEAFAAEHGITMSVEFVPWSQSRSFDAKIKDTSKKNLNWRVLVKKDGRDVLTTDYSAGIAHAPSYKQGARWTLDYTAVIEHEVETGKTAKPMPGGGFIGSGKPIMPTLANVLYSLVSDADVLDSSTFEDWARDLGYDEDSRSAEKTYRACLEIALKLRNGLGEKLLTELREAVSGY